MVASWCSVLLLLLAVARAQAWGTVETLWAPDADGILREVRETPEARRVRAAQAVDLQIGLDVAVGDRIETDRAQVRLRLEGGDQQLVLGPDAVLVVTETRSLLQEAGEVLYRVRGALRVRYASVEAAVEGTQFLVTVADGQLTVAVLEGEVRVTSQGQDVLLHPGEQSLASPATPPLPAQPAPRRPALPPRGDLRRGVGDSRLSLGVLASVSSYEDGGGLLPDGLGSGGLGAGWRMQAGLRVSPGWRLVAEAGTTSAAGRFLVPAALGAERRWGPWRLGVSSAGLIGPCSCADAALDVRLGGAGVGGLSLPLPAGLALESRARLGLTASVAGLEPPELLYDLALGVSWSP